VRERERVYVRLRRGGFRVGSHATARGWVTITRKRGIGSVVRSRSGKEEKRNKICQLIEV